MKTDLRTQSLIDSLLKANYKKSLFSRDRIKTIQRVKTQNIALDNSLTPLSTPQFIIH